MGTNSPLKYFIVGKKRHAVKGIGKRDYYIGIGVLLLVVILVAGPSIQQNGQTVLSGKGFSTTATSTGAGSNLCGVTKPLAVTEIDSLGGSGFNTPTGILYQGTGNPLILEGSISWSSAGLGTTSGKYSTGTPLAWQFSGASQVTQFVGGLNNIPFLVPAMTCGDTSTNNVFNIYGITLAAYTIAMTAGGGTTLATGGTYFFSQFPGGLTGTTTITVTVTANTNNQGAKSSYDFLNGLWQNMIVEIKDTSSNLQITGMPRQLSFGGGTTRTWPIACPDGLTGTGYGSANGAGTLTVQTAGSATSAGGNQQSQGTYDSQCAGSLTIQKIGNQVYGSQGASFSFGIAKGSLGSGSSESITVALFKYADWNWYVVNGVYGPNAAQLGAPSGRSAGTSFTTSYVNG